MLQRLLTVSVIGICLACCGQAANTTEKSNSDSTSIKAGADTVAPAASPVAQTLNPEPPDLLAAVRPFIPAGHSILDTASGDLNLDSLPDMALALKRDDEDSTADDIDHAVKRPLLLLIGQPDKTYKLAARCDNAIMCHDCGGMMGDPFQGLTIKKGYISAEHYGGSAWRWSRIITFKYAPEENAWFLHKDGDISYHTSDPDKTTEKILTTKDFGKVPMADFDVYKDR